MIEKCLYWPESKFREKKLVINDICGACGKQTECNILKRMLQKPEIVLNASGRKRKPRPQMRVDYKVVCKDCGKESIFCVCQKPSGFRLEKK